ncbi:MAG: putative Ig domain-containing protein [Blastocatellia bacterium]
MKRRMLIPLFTLSLLLSLVLWHAATEKTAAAAMQTTYPLNPASFTSLGASPFASAGTYTINTSKSLTAPVLTKPDNTTINGVFFTSSGGEIAVFTFDSINIPANVTVQGLRNANSRPIALLSKGNITIDGTVNVNGGAGGDPTPDNIGGAGGAAGPGGGGGGGGGSFDGGTPGTGGVGFVSGNNGTGGGGNGGSVSPNGGGVGATDYGTGGAFGGNGYGGSTFRGGTAYGDLAVSLQGGSGGSGGGATSGGALSQRGAGGGGGGGAVEIGAITGITISGSVQANGGGGGAESNRSGGGGAGGGIFLHGAAVTFSNLGGLSARGGPGGIGGVSGTGGGGGRVRIVATTTIIEGCINVSGTGLDPGDPGVYTTDGTVVKPPPSQLAFSQQPPFPGGKYEIFTKPNTAISPAVSVAILDVCGNLVTTATDTVTLALNNANGATLSGNTAVAVGGIATFSNLKVSKPGTGYTLTATSGSLTSATSTAFKITCQAITVTPPTGALTAGTTGVAYSQQFSQTSGEGTITWGISPAIPGLSIDSTGKLSGTPTEAGSFSFTVTATDGSGCPGSTNYSLVVNCPTVTLPTQTLADGTYNSVYSNVTISPTGGTAPYTFAVSGLPTGITRTPNAGSSGASLTLGGTPLQSGDFTIQVTVTDAYGCASQSKNYALHINKATPVITWSLPAYLPSGPLAASLLNAMANTTGTFSYTPTAGTVLAPGTITLMANFTPNDAANYTSASQSVTLPVLDASCSTNVNPATLPTATRGTPFVQTLTASPTGSYVFSVLSGTLPPGINLMNTLGIYSLRGIPTTAGSYTFTIKAAKNNSTCAGARTYTVVVP